MSACNGEVSPSRGGSPALDSDHPFAALASLARFSPENLSTVGNISANGTFDGKARSIRVFGATMVTLLSPPLVTAATTRVSSHNRRAHRHQGTPTGTRASGRVPTMAHAWLTVPAAYLARDILGPGSAALWHIGGLAGETDP